MYPVKRQVDFLKFVNESKKKQKLLNKIQVVKKIACKALCGYGNFTYHRLTLKEIEIIKQIFVLQIQQCEEVFIPYRLSLKQFSLCYQFYDPLFTTIDSLSTSEKKNSIILDNKMKIKMVRDERSIIEKTIKFLSMDN